LNNVAITSCITSSSDTFTYFDSGMDSVVDVVEDVAMDLNAMTFTLWADHFRWA
jgi:tRNA A-37 threonylcarbamoyl transferase component Bud32